MRYRLKKVKTGISGLDKILFGGIPKGSIVLVSGAAGTGKTILCLEFVYHGAKKFNEPGVFLSTEQNEEDLKNQLRSFGWECDPLVKKGLLTIKKIEIGGSNDIIEEVAKLVKKTKAKRLVIDSLTTFTEFLSPIEIEERGGIELIKTVEKIFPIPLSESLVAKGILFKLMDNLKKLKCTTLVTSELPEKGNWLSRDTVSEFICDGVIELQYLGIVGSDVRNLRIRKMRYTDHMKNYIPYEIVPKKGIVLKPEEAMAVLMR
jgi:KaiC/GvpD/RAD55 family RecA-like ATPase